MNARADRIWPFSEVEKIDGFDYFYGMFEWFKG